MSRGVNKVILIGTAGHDPETRYMQNGNSVTNASIATTEYWKDKQTGEKSEQTEWHRLVFYGKLAEIAGEYLRKGSKVYVEGSIKTRKWQDQSGQDRYSTEIIVKEMQLLDSKPQQNQQAQQQAPQNQKGPRHYQNGQDVTQYVQANPQAQERINNNYKAQQQRPVQQPAPEFDDFDDDIPF